MTPAPVLNQRRCTKRPRSTTMKTSKLHVIKPATGLDTAPRTPAPSQAQPCQRDRAARPDLHRDPRLPAANPNTRALRRRPRWTRARGRGRWLWIRSRSARWAVRGPRRHPQGRWRFPSRTACVCAPGRRPGQPQPRSWRRPPSPVRGGGCGNSMRFTVDGLLGCDSTSSALYGCMHVAAGGCYGTPSEPAPAANNRRNWIRYLPLQGSTHPPAGTAPPPAPPCSRGRPPQWPGGTCSPSHRPQRTRRGQMWSRCLRGRGAAGMWEVRRGGVLDGGGARA